MKKLIYIGPLILLCACLVFFVCWFFRHEARSDVVAMSNEYLLSDEELNSLPNAALQGNCNAAIRLGDYYMTQMASPREAEKWYRVADACSNDPRTKEFLIRCIVLNEKNASTVRDVTRLFRQIEKLDPERAERMRRSTELYIRGTETIRPTS